MLLPYPKFSWSLNHHIGPVAKPETMFSMLQAAYIYGNNHNYSDLIDHYLEEQDLLTRNIRTDAGKSQTFRDYQQVLSELGLIISTTLTRDFVQLTPIGLMWLDGLIGYSELITTQALRYQYPNGHKRDLSSTVKEALLKSKIQYTTRTELDAAFGVMIKPAVLILRILLELQHKDSNPGLSVRECVTALFPVKRNIDWQQGIAHLTAIRVNTQPLVSEGRELRHVQEWFRLLGFTDIFQVADGAISLKAKAKENVDWLYDLCNYHENLSSFWIPPQDSQQYGFSWFNYYGGIDIQDQWLLPDISSDKDYAEQNYSQGINEPDDEAYVKDIFLNPQPFNPIDFTNMVTNVHPVNVRKITEGHIKRQKNTRLHEQIVNEIATRLTAAGYEVQEDRQSIDLLATKHERETIIEVKTINRRNLFTRLRLGVGQLLEYRYRRQIQTNERPDAVLVLSSKPALPDWVVNYFEDEINLGLLSMKNQKTFYPHTHGEIEKLLSAEFSSDTNL